MGCGRRRWWHARSRPTARTPSPTEGSTLRLAPTVTAPDRFSKLQSWKIAYNGTTLASGSYPTQPSLTWATPAKQLVNGKLTLTTVSDAGLASTDSVTVTGKWPTATFLNASATHVTRGAWVKLTATPLAADRRRLVQRGQGRRKDHHPVAARQHLVQRLLRLHQPGRCVGARREQRVLPRGVGSDHRRHRPRLHERARLHHREALTRRPQRGGTPRTPPRGAAALRFQRQSAEQRAPPPSLGRAYAPSRLMSRL